MQATVAILGRQPAISTAELEAIFGADKVRPVNQSAVEISVPPEEFFWSDFGGVIKTGKLLAYLETTQWSELVGYIYKTLPDHLQYLPEGKIKFGLSLYGIKSSVKDVNRAGIKLKKLIKLHGRSVRVIPNTELALNTAQVEHNRLSSSTLGMELLLIRDGKRTILAQTIGIQNIKSYTIRDRERPKRDAKVGMLPPKLAQIIINLACGNKKKQTILDPFCGTGVVLQESMLLGHAAYGTDIDKRMVQYATQNIAWLRDTFHAQVPCAIEQGDARKHQWQDFDIVAGETYLGEPLTSLPSLSHLEEIVRANDKLHREFLENLASQMKKGQRACLAMPAWRLKSQFKHLPCLDDLEKLGYTRVSFAHASNKELIYFRDDQFVARELVVLVRK